MKPLLFFENYGIHLIKNPAETFSFVGSIPEELTGKCYRTYDEGMAAFITFFTSMPVEIQKQHVGNLRNDIFKRVMEA